MCLIAVYVIYLFRVYYFIWPIRLKDNVLIKHHDSINRILGIDSRCPLSSLFFPSINSSKEMSSERNIILQKIIHGSSYVIL